jgi:predicted nucleic acid-binding protein
MIVLLRDVPQLLQSDPNLKNGCVVDTNVLFAASFPLDTYNTWAEKLFPVLHELGIPIYTNINVRSEFIELNRRVLIPEGLIDFYEDLAGQLVVEVEQKLKSLKTRKETAAKENRTFKLSDFDIKEFRRLLSGYTHSTGKNGWELFCEDYFHKYIRTVWEDVVEALKIGFLGTRNIDNKTLFDNHPNWDDMLDIVGKTGMGSTDAMIVNLFLKSKLSMIISTDNDVPGAVEKMLPPGSKRFVLIPD